ncbi:MAG: TonB family protein [Myxococcales bacterium]|nr:TonB family protein [Myxococcales bacterium]
MRWDSPFVLATAGTIAIHLALITAGDAFVAYNPPKKPQAAPRIEVVDIEVPPVVKPPPPPVVKPPEVTPPTPEPPVEQKRTVARTQVRPQVRATEPPPPETPLAPPAPDTPEGGEQVVQMENIAPSATGVGVAVGRRTSERVGRGGTGGGTGTGSGDGEAPPPPPRSVATIKKRAMPKGDYSYWSAGKDYPPEARQLGIEGKILVRLVVDETGKVRSTTLVSKLGHGLDELALARAKDLQFDPAIDTDGNPVSSVVVWTFDMTLPK